MRRRAASPSLEAYASFKKVKGEATASEDEEHVLGKEDNDEMEIVGTTSANNYKISSSDTEGILRERPNTPDPFESLARLTDGTVFAARYQIGPGSIEGKPNILFAVDKTYDNEKVILKFCASEESFQKSKTLHQRLSSDYVCMLLNVIDSKDGFPPCLVFERGDDRLDDWIQRTHPNLMSKKNVLFQILECIFHLHDQGVVHCDIKPANVMFFLCPHSWKLLDTDTIVEKDESCFIQCTPMYASPEMIQAEENGLTTISAETWMDMWAFGILAFEVLTGNRFYGLSATEESVKECLTGRRQLPSLECVKDWKARKLLSGLLCVKSEDRWSAQKALNCEVFQKADDTTQEANGIDKILQKIEDAIATHVQDAVDQIKDLIQNLKETLPGEIKRQVIEAVVSEIREVGIVVKKSPQNFGGRS